MDTYQKNKNTQIKRKHSIRFISFAVCFLLSFLLTGCGEDKELTQFKEAFESFCIEVSTLDTAINKIDASDENAEKELLGYIDRLENEFEKLAQLNFPEEFQYLENLSDEASGYMKEAAKAYHTAYEGESFASNYNDYAFENYKRAYRRIQIILAYLHGEDPKEAGLMITYGE